MYSPGMVMGPLKPQMLPQLKSLWMRCFGDGGDYTELVFSGLIRAENALVAEEEGLVRAMLFTEPFDFAYVGGQVRGAYIYGVATDPAVQGQGISTALLEYAHKILSGRGFACSALVPATTSLHRFYEKRGYEPFTSLRKLKVMGTEIAPVQEPVALCSELLENCTELRDSCFRPGGFVRWGREYLAFNQRQYASFGGGTLRWDKGYLTWYRDSEVVFLKEFGAAAAELPVVLPELHSMLQAQEYRICLQSGALHSPAEYSFSYTQTLLPYSMIKWYDVSRQKTTAMDKGSAYLAFALD